jgi:hypothetical protein
MVGAVPAASITVVLLLICLEIIIYSQKAANTSLNGPYIGSQKNHCWRFAYIVSRKFIRMQIIMHQIRALSGAVQ